MTDRKAFKRALERLGFVFLRSGWVRREDAPRLQAQIERAVQAAAKEVESVKVSRSQNCAGHND